MNSLLLIEGMSPALPLDKVDIPVSRSSKRYAAISGVSPV